MRNHVRYTSSIAAMPGASLLNPLRSKEGFPKSTSGDQPHSCSDPFSPRLPADLLRRVLKLVDFSTQLAALCVCREWNEAVSEPIFWRRISVPKSLACRLWDDEFGPLIKKACGELRALQVSGSGITSRSLITLSQSRAFGPVLEELRMEHCCNLTGIDIVHFVEAITSRTGGPRIQFLAIEGCSQVSPHDVERLAARVERLDVGICVCSRVDSLERCPGRGCLGLCRHCSELYRGCGLACGSCCQPQNSHQELRAQAHRNFQRIAGLRTRWKDVRHGIASA